MDAADASTPVGCGGDDTRRLAVGSNLALVGRGDAFQSGSGLGVVRLSTCVCGGCGVSGISTSCIRWPVMDRLPNFRSKLSSAPRARFTPWSVWLAPPLPLRPPAPKTNAGRIAGLICRFSNLWATDVLGLSAPLILAIYGSLVDGGDGVREILWIFSSGAKGIVGVVGSEIARLRFGEMSEAAAGGGII